MIQTSRRVRAEEKRLLRKLILNTLAILGFILFAVYIGFPIFTRLLIFGSNKSTLVSEEAAPLIFAPVLDPLPEATNSSSLRVSGYAEKKSEVKIVVADSSEISVPVDEEGRFSSDKVKLKEGENTIFAKTNKDGKESSRSTAYKITYKKEPPKLEISSPNNDESFSGENKDITVSGITDHSNRVTVNDRVAIVDQNGTFHYIFRLPEGETTLKITAYDAAGNQTTVERKVKYNP